MSTSNRPSGLHVILRSSWRRWLVVVVVVVVAVSVVLIHRFDGPPTAGTAEVTVGQDPPTYDQQRRADVTVLLDQWARAVRSGDLDALRDVMDPQADPGFVEAQLRRAAVVPGVPFAEFGYDLGDEPETPVPPSIAAALDSTDVWAPAVYLRYAITGPDASPTRRPVSLVVAERDGRWRLVDDADLTEYRRQTWRGPWDFGPLTVRSVATAAGTSVVMGHPDRDAFVENLTAELPSAIAAVTDFWGDDWAGDGLIFVASSAEEFAELTGSDPSTDVAAVTVSDAVAADGSRPTGQRVVFGVRSRRRVEVDAVHRALGSAARVDACGGEGADVRRYGVVGVGGVRRLFRVSRVRCRVRATGTHSRGDRGGGWAADGAAEERGFRCRWCPVECGLRIGLVGVRIRGRPVRGVDPAFPVRSARVREPHRFCIRVGAGTRPGTVRVLVG